MHICVYKCLYIKYYRDIVPSSLDIDFEFILWIHTHVHIHRFTLISVQGGDNLFLSEQVFNIIVVIIILISSSLCAHIT